LYGDYHNHIAGGIDSISISLLVLVEYLFKGENMSYKYILIKSLKV